MATTNRQKFETKNTVVRGLIGRFHQKIASVVADLEPKNILELGCGEGFLLNALRQRLRDIPMLGLDNSQVALGDGHKIFPDLKLELGDIYRIKQLDHQWDVVIASEVLEHLERPADALRELGRTAGRFVVLSVPWEPWFRLGSLGRGKHLHRFGNHPEHINLWSQAAFRAFVATELKIVKVVGAFPWTIVVAKAKS